MNVNLSGILFKWIEEKLTKPGVSRAVADIIPFKKKSLKERHKGKTLCGHGFHKWQVEKESVFDSKQGRLVTRWKCCRCGQTKVTGQ